jgi:hypothetical protein
LPHRAHNVDGVDISDETVGTTTSNVSASAIDEFQLSQSSRSLAGLDFFWRN